jgi:hypothetical protein
VAWRLRSWSFDQTRQSSKVVMAALDNASIIYQRRQWDRWWARSWLIYMDRGVAALWHVDHDGSQQLVE